MTNRRSQWLTEKQKKFVDCYLDHGDVKLAATAAGYSRPTRLHTARILLLHSVGIARTLDERLAGD